MHVAVGPCINKLGHFQYSDLLFKNIVMAGIIAKKMKFPALCLYLTCTCT